MTKLVSKCTIIIEKIICYMLILVINPTFFMFEMSIVRPIIIKTYNYGLIKYIFHTLCPTFIFINIIGNTMMCILTDTSLKTSEKNGKFCEICKLHRSERTWHCPTCNICILRRDHHCCFFSRCIGLKNLRFYVLYLGYNFLSLVYATFYNYYYVSTKLDNDILLSALTMINPFLRHITAELLSMRDLYMFFLFLNVSLVIWCGALFWIHIRNVFYGVTTREYTLSQIKEKRNLKQNLVKAFGVKWYLAVICPFVYSPVPADD